jgi:hypothetical protein
MVTKKRVRERDLFLGVASTWMSGQTSTSGCPRLHRVTHPRSDSHALFPMPHPDSRDHEGACAYRTTHPTHAARLHTGTAHAPLRFPCSCTQVPFASTRQCPSNCSRRLRQVCPTATPDLLLQHPDKIFATYIRNN